MYLMCPVWCHNAHVRLRCSTLSGLLYPFHCKYLLGLLFSIGPCIRVCVCVCDPAASFLLPPPFTAPVCVRLFRDSLSVGVCVCDCQRGWGVGVAACRISPSSLLATELFGAGRWERKRKREKSGEKENRRDREEERGIENMPHLEKAKACGVSRKERDR